MWIKIYSRIIKQTRKAIQIDPGIWLPKSLCKIGFDSENKDIIYVQEWFAEKKGLSGEKYQDHEVLLREKLSIPKVEIIDELKD